MIDWNIIAVVVAVVGSILGLARWIFGQFASLKTFVFDQSEKLLNKLEYHERHDDSRFGEVNKAIQNIMIQNAVLSARDYRTLKDLNFEQKD